MSTIMEVRPDASLSDGDDDQVDHGWCECTEDMALCGEVLDGDTEECPDGCGHEVCQLCEELFQFYLEVYGLEGCPRCADL